jgi:hypothetical protein
LSGLSLKWGLDRYSNRPVLVRPGVSKLHQQAPYRRLLEIEPAAAACQWVVQLSTSEDFFETAKPCVAVSVPSRIRPFCESEVWRDIQMPDTAIAWSSCRDRWVSRRYALAPMTAIA